MNYIDCIWIKDISKKIYIVCTCQKDIEKSPSGKKFLSSPWNNIEKYWEILWKVYLVKNVYCQSEKRENSNHIPFSKCLFFSILSLILNDIYFEACFEKYYEDVPCCFDLVFNYCFWKIFSSIDILWSQYCTKSNNRWLFVT